MSIGFSQTEPLNTTFGVNWPAVLDSWFRALLRQEPTTSPQVTNAEWEVWLTAVAQHGMSALVYTWLLRAPAEKRPPPSIMTELRAVHIDYIALAERRRRQLTDLVTSFAEAGISPIVLKGAALAHTLYESPELRPSSDIDLLVQPVLFDSAWTKLLNSGYESVLGEFRHYRHAEPLKNKEYKLPVDLHKSVSSFPQVKANIKVPALFENALREKGIDVLNASDTLLLASMHLFYNHHNNWLLIWLYDIHLLVQYIEGEQAWQNLMASSVKWQARVALSQALTLAHQFFGTQFPKLIADLSQFPPTADELRLSEFTVLHQKPTHLKASRMRRHLFQLQEFGNNRERFLYLRNRIFPDRQQLKYYYPQVASWPLPLAHIGRWVLSIFGREK